jgi:hypothetical protein
MGELEDRPAFAPDAAHGPAAAGEQLARYLRRLREMKLIRADVNHHAAIAMLLGACFADAMGREIMPAMFPQPADDAAREYTRLFLAALGFEIALPRSGRKRVRSTTHRSNR